MQLRRWSTAVFVVLFLIGTLAYTLSPYVPRISAEWDLDAPGATWRSIESTCVYIDISGWSPRRACSSAAT